MQVKGLHHVAYRCRDAKETVDFYAGVLGLKYAMAVSEDRVPSTGEHSPYMHVFFEMDDGSYVAFFEVPESPPMQRDPNTPDWVQHLALKVATMDDLRALKSRLEAASVEVIGPVDHKICQSIYFFDPNGHRLEFACDTMTAEMADELGRLARPMLAEWTESKRTLSHAAWVHEGLHEE